MLALTWDSPVVTAMLTTADTFISKTSRLYRDTRTAQATGAAGHMERLNEDLQDVTRIMTKNMEDLLWRGDSLDRKCLRIVYQHMLTFQACRISPRPFAQNPPNTAKPRATSTSRLSCASGRRSVALASSSSCSYTGASSDCIAFCTPCKLRLAYNNRSLLP